MHINKCNKNYVLWLCKYKYSYSLLILIEVHLTKWTLCKKYYRNYFTFEVHFHDLPLHWIILKVHTICQVENSGQDFWMWILCHFSFRIIHILIVSVLAVFFKGSEISFSLHRLNIYVTIYTVLWKLFLVGSKVNINFYVSEYHKSSQNESSFTVTWYYARRDKYILAKEEDRLSINSENL